MRTLLLIVYIISIALAGFCQQERGYFLPAIILLAFTFIAFSFFSVWNTPLPRANALNYRSGNFFLLRMQWMAGAGKIFKRGLVSRTRTINHKRGGHGPAFFKKFLMCVVNQ